MPHTIRLRGPWTEQPREGGGRLLMRRFHRPTGLDADSQVWLVIEGVAEEAEVTLNDRPLGICGPIGRFDITAELLPSNLLSIAVSTGPLGPVRLEID